MQLLRYFENMNLSIPIDIVRFSPGGPTVQSFMWRKTVTIRQCLRKVREYRTRTQKIEFKRKVQNVASIQPALLEMMYQELCLDSSTANHPDTVQSIHAMFLGAPGLVADLVT